MFVSNTQNIKEKVRKRFNISNEKKIILYAPTYRDWEDGFGTLNIDVKKWKYELGKEYVLFYRAHPTIKLKYSYGDSDFF